MLLQRWWTEGAQRSPLFPIIEWKYHLKYCCCTKLPSLLECSLVIIWRNRNELEFEQFCLMTQFSEVRNIIGQLQIYVEQKLSKSLDAFDQGILGSVWSWTMDPTLIPATWGKCVELWGQLFSTYKHQKPSLPRIVKLYTNMRNLHIQVSN